MSGIVRFKKVALDSNVFIYHFEDNPEFAPFVTKVFTKLIQGNLHAYTSVVSIIETLSFPLTAQAVKTISAEFLNIPNLNIIDVNQQIGAEAARIRRQYKFRLPDSVQLATAKLAKVNVFIGNDKQLKQFKELKVILLNEI